MDVESIYNHLLNANEYQLYIEVMKTMHRVQEETRKQYANK